MAIRRSKPGYKLINLREMAQLETVACFRTLVKIRDCKEVDPGIRAKVCGMILDRGWGKPVQEVNVSDNRTAREYTLDELLAIAQGSGDRGGSEAPGTESVN